MFRHMRVTIAREPPNLIPMRATRVEAFTDAVIAILITIMILELPKPDGPDITALAADLPVLLTYVLSFVYLGICWNNHHHMFQAASHVRGGVLWANLHLLFWLSFVPFVTGWMSEQGLERWPVIVYGVVLLAAGAAFWILQTTLIRAEGDESRLGRAVGRNLKGKLTLAGYAVGIVVAIFVPVAGLVVYALVLVAWLVPDRRVEDYLVPPANAEIGDDDRSPA
jgi:uncharacterized membrane protein